MLSECDYWLHGYKYAGILYKLKSDVLIKTRFYIRKPCVIQQSCNKRHHCEAYNYIFNDVVGRCSHPQGLAQLICIHD